MVKRGVIFFIGMIMLARLSTCCIAMEPSMHMGDTENTVSFKFVSADPCDSPVVNLKNIDKGTYVQIPSYTSDEYACVNTTYHRYSYFFKAEIIQGDTYFWSFRSDNDLGPFQFNIRDLKDSKNPRFIQIGDMEYSNNSVQTFQALNQMDWRKYDGFIHAGDYAYDMSSDQCLRGERYFNALSNVLPVVPAMLILGNHENYDTGRLFNFRFRFPNYNTQLTNNFYSQVRGQVFFLFVNYDYFITWNRNPESLALVLAYIEAELKKSQAEGIKWTVVVSHRAIYCGEYATRKDCTANYYMLKPFDDMYRKYKVDLLIAGHEHFYERLHGIDSNFNLEIIERLNSQGVTEISNSPHPILITNGCAGNKEFVNPNLTLP